MKIDELARPGLMALGVVGIAATTLLGFAVGLAMARDPQALRLTARRVVREAARGLERASLMAAQAREHVGDLWAEAREEALAEVDAADFKRATAGASQASPTAAGGVGTAGVAPAPQGQAPQSQAPRKRASRPRKPRVSRAAAKKAVTKDTTGQA